MVFRNEKILRAIVERERVKLCQNDPRARGWGQMLRQILEAIRALKHRIDTDAATPRSRLTPTGREIVKEELSDYSVVVRIAMALQWGWEVALPLGFLYWAFNMGARP